MTTTESGLAISYTKEKFEAGEYKFIIEVFTNDAYKENFEFANNFNLIVDGKDCICVPVMPSIKAGPREWISAATADSNPPTPSNPIEIMSIFATSSPSFSSIAKLNENVVDPTFTVTQGEPATLTGEGWYKEEGGTYVKFTGDKFVDGKYIYRCRAALNDANYKFADSIFVAVDNFAWATPVKQDDGTFLVDSNPIVVKGICKITFNPGEFGEGTMEEKSVPINTKFKVPICEFTSTDENKEFDHWSYMPVKTPLIAIPEQEITVNDDLELTAIWTDKTANPPTTEKIKVTFIKNKHGGDPATFVKEIDKGSTVERPADPTDDAFDFGGWYTEDECRNPFDFDTIIETNTELYAKWTPKTQNPNDPQNPPANEKVTITFDPGEGSGTMNPVEKDKNSKYTLPACEFTAPPNTVFTGWKYGDTIYDAGTEINVGETDITLIAQWEDWQNPPPASDKVKVHFLAGEGSGTMASVEVNKNSEYKLPASTFTAPLNKEFKAWKYNDEEKAVGATITVGETDVRLTALWKDKTTTPITPPTPEPPTPPSPHRPNYDDDYYYIPHRPHRPYRPSYKPSIETASRDSDTKPASKTNEELILRVILTEGSKELEKYLNASKSITLMDVAPYIKGGRIMLPIRYVAEALGMSVRWDAETRTVFINDMFYSVEIPVDTNIIKVNGKVYSSDVKPEIKYSRTMLPIANVARALDLVDGKDIFWDGETRKATIIRKLQNK